MPGRRQRGRGQDHALLLVPQVTFDQRADIERGGVKRGPAGARIHLRPVDPLGVGLEDHVIELAEQVGQRACRGSQSLRQVRQRCGAAFRTRQQRLGQRLQPLDAGRQRLAQSFPGELDLGPFGQRARARNDSLLLAVAARRATVAPAGEELAHRGEQAHRWLEAGLEAPVRSHARRPRPAPSHPAADRVGRRPPVCASSPAGRAVRSRSQRASSASVTWKLRPFVVAASR